MRGYPQVGLLLGISSQPAGLLAEAIDCVLGLDDPAISSMARRAVGHVRMVMCRAPAYLAEHGIPPDTRCSAAWVLECDVKQWLR